MTLIGVNAQGIDPRRIPGTPEYEATFGMLGKKKTGAEDAVQKSFVALFSRKYPACWRLLYHIRNSGFKKRLQGSNGKIFSSTGNKEKALGVVPGASDLCLAINNGFYAGWYIEVKKPGGTESDKQNLFGQMVMVMGFKYSVIDNLQIFEPEMDKYMSAVSEDNMKSIIALEEKFQMHQATKAQKFQPR